MKLPQQTFWIALSSASLTWAVPAAAFTITTGGTPVANEGQYTSVAGATTVNFNNPPPNGGLPSNPVYTSAVSTPAVVVGNSPGQYSSPTGDTSPFLTISPSGSSSIPPNRGGTGPVTINFSGVGGGSMNYFGLYWGTIDSYNSIAFYRGATQIGSTIFGGTNGLTAGSTVFVNFTFTNAEAFDRVVLTSTTAAFETDNHAYREVPVPPSFLGILLAGTIGAVKTLKRQQQQS